MLVVALSEGLGSGTKVSSIYPPVARYYHRPVAELPQKGVLCQSIGNKVVFFVLSIPECEGLAVHVQVQVGSTGSRDYVKRFKVRKPRYEHNMLNRFGRGVSKRYGGLTALTLARNIGLVDWTASECRKDGRWRDYVNVQSTPEGHVRAVPSVGQRMEARIALCRLVWAKNWIDEEPH